MLRAFVITFLTGIGAIVLALLHVDEIAAFLSDTIPSLTANYSFENERRASSPNPRSSSSPPYSADKGEQSSPLEHEDGGAFNKADFEVYSPTQPKSLPGGIFLGKSQPKGIRVSEKKFASKTSSGSSAWAPVRYYKNEVGKKNPPRSNLVLRKTRGSATRSCR